MNSSQSFKNDQSHYIFWRQCFYQNSPLERFEPQERFESPLKDVSLPLLNSSAWPNLGAQQDLHIFFDSLCSITLLFCHVLTKLATSSNFWWCHEARDFLFNPCQQSSFLHSSYRVIIVQSLAIRCCLLRELARNSRNLGLTS